MLRYEYKLRFYQLSGPDKGNLSHEKFFQDREQMMVRYREVFRQDLYAYNPTAWQYVDNEWTRLSV